jgi:DNA-binding XRE family transcriptional regulator
MHSHTGTTARSALTPRSDRVSVLTKATLRAAEILGLTNTVLARVIGVSPATITRMSRGDYLLREGSKEWELSTLLVRLYRGLDAITAADERALHAWMNNENLELQARPIDLIGQVQGLVETVAYVDAYRARI